MTCEAESNGCEKWRGDECPGEGEENAFAIIRDCLFESCLLVNGRHDRASESEGHVNRLLEEQTIARSTRNCTVILIMATLLQTPLQLRRVLMIPDSSTIVPLSLRLP